jgi:hypothetical protein
MQRSTLDKMQREKALAVGVVCAARTSLCRGSFSARSTHPQCTLHTPPRSLVAHNLTPECMAGGGSQSSEACNDSKERGGDLMRSPSSYYKEIFSVRVGDAAQYESRCQKNAQNSNNIAARVALMFAGAEMMIDIFPVFALRHNGCRRARERVGAGNLLMHHGPLFIIFPRR